MNILAINKYYQITGGADTYCFLLSHLLERGSHTVIPFCLAVDGNRPTPYASYFVTGLTWYNWRIARWSQRVHTAVTAIYNREARQAMSYLLRGIQPDIAHIHNIYYQISPSILSVIEKYKIPTVQTLHDYQPICPNAFLYTKGQVCERCKRGRYYQAFIHRCFRGDRGASFVAALATALHHLSGLYPSKVDKFTTPSEFARQKMVQFGIDPEKIVTIPHPIDTESYIPNSAGDNYLIFVGRLEPRKGLKTLVRAMKGISTPLIVIGDGPKTYLQEIATIIEHEKLQHIKLVGRKSPEEVKQYMGDSRFVVVPSEWYENHPAVVREAFALGKPVVASRIGGIPELVVEEETGLLFEPGNANDLRDKLTRLLGNQSLIRSLGENARRKAEHDLNLDLHLERILRFYASAIREKRALEERR